MKSRFNSWFVNGAFALLFGVSAIACGDQEGRSPELMSGQKELSEEEARIQKLLKINVWNVRDSKWVDMSVGDVGELLPASYRPVVQEVDGQTYIDLCREESRQLLMFAGNYLDLAMSLNKIAKSLTPITVIAGEIPYQIPTQSATARVGLFYGARRAALHALGDVLSALNDPKIDLSMRCLDLDDQIAGEYLAEVFELAYNAYIEATDGAVEQSVVAGDAQRTEAPSAEVGRRRAYGGLEFSRSAAAHLIVGGDRGPIGWLGDSDPFCSAMPLAPTAKRALELIRNAAPNPTDVTNVMVDTGNLIGGSLAGTGAMPVYGTVAQRLSSFWHLSSSASSPAPMTDLMNLSLDDFRAAREYMVKEISTLKRSRTANLTTDISAEFSRFAGTASAGKPLPNVAYSALSRAGMGTAWGTSDETLPVLKRPSGVWHSDLSALNCTSDPNLDEFRTLVAQTATTIQSTVDARIAGSSYATRLKSALKTRLISLADSIRSQAWGQISVSRYSDKVRVGIAVTRKDGDPIDVRFIRGFDGLRCFLDGNIEGAPCKVSEYIAREEVSHVFKNSVEPFPSGKFYEVNLSKLSGYFFVADVTGATPKVVFGEYISTPSDDTATPGDGKTMIFEESDHRVEKLVGMSGDWCGETRYDCLGDATDARLPLENELSKDTLDVESSWKNYLELAKQAASEANERGKEYIAAGLEVELRKEQLWRDRDSRARQAVEELQSICGTAIDPRDLIEYISKNDATTCNSNADCGSSRYSCIAGMCIIDFNVLAQEEGNTNTELNRLAKCVSGEVVPFAGLGDKPLCVWTTGDGNNVCQGSTKEMPCPTLATNGACSEMKVPNTAGRVLVADSALLKYFQADPPGETSSQSQKTRNEICAAIRKIRGSLVGDLNKSAGTKTISSKVRTELIEKIKASSVFHPDNFNRQAKLFSSELSLLSNISIRYGGSELWTTGRVGLDTLAGSARWPCQATDRPVECSNGDTKVAGILCDYADCTDAKSRGRIVARLQNALEAASDMYSGTGAGMMIGSTLNIGNQEGYWDYCESKGETELIDRSITGRAPIVVRSCDVGGYQYDGVHATFKTYSVNGDNEDRIVWWGGKYLSWAGFPEELRADWFEDATRGSGVRLRVGGEILLSHLPEYPREDGGFFLNGLSRAAHVEVAKGRSTNTPTVRDTLNGVAPVTWGSATDRGTGPALDAVELYCEAGAKYASSCDGNAPTISGANDLVAAKTYMECLADGINARAGQMVVARVPQQAMDAMRKAGTTGAFPSMGGTYGEAVSGLRGALVELADVAPAIAFEVRQLATDIEVIRATLDINKVRKDMADYQMMSSLSNALTGCAQYSFSAIAGCANALAQVSFLGQLKNLQKEEADLSSIKDLAEFRSQLETRARTLGQYGSRIGSALESIDSQLAGLEGQRLGAQRHLADALYAATSSAPNSELIDNALAWKYHEAQRRYEESTKTAKKLAIVARRAIEQRLSLRFADLTEELPLVEAPSTWYNDVCRAEGATFESIAASSSEGSTSGDTYESNPFLGNLVYDYVSKLERTIESYRMKYPFQDGVDEAVVSLRNDLLKTRTRCSVASTNEIVNSDRMFDASGRSTVAGSGWFIDGCPQITTEGATKGDTMACLKVTPAFEAILEGSRMAAAKLDFSQASCRELGCTVNNSKPKLGNRFTLEAGWYVFSYWYRSDSECGVWPAIRGSGGENVSMELVGPTLGVDWVGDPVFDNMHAQRIRVYVPTTGEYTLSFEDTQQSCYTAPTGKQSTIVAGPMLVRITQDEYDNRLSGANRVVIPYVSADRNGQVELPICEDKSGNAFRLGKWSERKCVRLCSDGYSDVCDERSGTLECYRELRFSLDDSKLESSALFQASGFAKGNYNYRIETVGVNFVGTGIRDCSESANAESCFANGNVQYTLEHLGPFFVRNHWGKDVESLVFNGRIEHARGLASERYLTNPMSSTDRTLMEPYIRSEFQGRPMGGEYVLKVWDSSDAVFDNIDDVQFLWRYRYWTRQN